MTEEDLLLDPVGDDYPSLVGEALLSLDNDEFSCSASLSENGYVWMVVGRRLFVWKLENEKASANAAYQLSLPPSGLPYNVRTVRVYLRPNSSNVGVIAISPEGTIRHWPNIGRSYSDSSVDLEREVALSLDEVIDSGELVQICFLVYSTPIDSKRHQMFLIL
ncbi:unnamed protein product [Anisakis simplex]|uniref:Nuclear pore complex protein 15 (inferred by orthology to a C. elegans protein) n=1 Tax=Anisakis simplex TaxID=6269 RepID=A0A0M3KGJ5_ANISI|nr:unnamed protein product [Anisakis simplex]